MNDDLSNIHRLFDSLDDKIDANHKCIMEYIAVFKIDTIDWRNTLRVQIDKLSTILEAQNNVLSRQDKMLTIIEHDINYFKNQIVENSKDISTLNDKITNLNKEVSNIIRDRFVLLRVASAIGGLMGFLAAAWVIVKDIIQFK